MAQTRLGTLRSVLAPKLVKWTGLAVALLGSYDIISNQLELPHLRVFIGMSGVLLPWWGWLLILQTLFVYGLFEYVRVTLPAPSSQVVTTIVSPSLADGDSKKLAGKLSLLGELLRQPNFIGCKPNTTDEMYMRDFFRSTHIIWTREDALQLRREFQEQANGVIAANNSHNANERAMVLQKVDKTISALNKILLGDA